MAGLAAGLAVVAAVVALVAIGNASAADEREFDPDASDRSLRTRLALGAVTVVAAVALLWPAPYRLADGPVGAIGSLGASDVWAVWCLLLAIVVAAVLGVIGRYPVVALSNGNADVHRVGLGQHFHHSISAREFGVGKPDARIFHAAAEAAGVRPGEVLHVGDDAQLDALGGLIAGLQVAWVNRDGREWEHAPLQPHLTVPDLMSLCNQLA